MMRSFRCAARSLARCLLLGSALALSAGFAPGAGGHAFAQVPQTRAPEPMLLPVDPAPLRIATDDGEQLFSIEVADDDSERSAGLMFRTEMDDDHGMLFVFEHTRRLSFWMKNTPMPLDLVFIDEDGVIVDVLEGEPFSIAPIAPESPARFVLELKAGTAEKAGIANGDRVRHPRIDAVAGGG